MELKTIYIYKPEEFIADMQEMHEFGPELARFINGFLRRYKIEDRGRPLRLLQIYSDGYCELLTGGSRTARLCSWTYLQALLKSKLPQAFRNDVV